MSEPFEYIPPTSEKWSEPGADSLTERKGPPWVVREHVLVDGPCANDCGREASQIEPAGPWNNYELRKVCEPCYESLMEALAE